MSSLTLTMKLDGDATQLLTVLESLRQYAGTLAVAVELTVIGQLEVNETFSIGPSTVDLKMHIRDFLRDTVYERPSNCLLRNQIDTVGGLVKKTECDLMTIPGFGMRSLNLVKTKLSEVGLELAPDRLGWAEQQVR